MLPENEQSAKIWPERRGRVYSRAHQWWLNLVSSFPALREAGRSKGLRGRWELSDAQGKLIEPILRPKRRADDHGRPGRERPVLNGILWVVGTGAQWRELTEKISAIPDLPWPFPAVGARRQAGAHLAGPSEGVTRPRLTPTGGGFHRRLLHGGQERGPRGPAYQARQWDENRRSRR